MMSPAQFFRGLPSLRFALVAVVCTQLAERSVGKVPKEHEILRYDVDLEHTPGTRFSHVWADFLKRRGHAAFAQTYAGWQEWLQQDMPELYGTPIARAETESKWLATLQASHPDAAAELDALSTVLQRANSSEPLFKLPALATLVSTYPLLNIQAKNTTDTKPSACTSTLVRTSAGTVLHGRSLDYEPRAPMANATVVLDFHLRGERQYRCLHPLVYTTALQWFTCVRPGAFSLSVNARGQGIQTEHNTSFAELRRRVAGSGALFLGEIAERAMKETSFEAALATLVSNPVVSSNYFILAGASGQGAVVTRFGNSSSADVWSLGSSPDWSDGQPSWLRVQTNVDHWVPISSGAYATHRRQHVIDLLTGMHLGAIDKDRLLNVYFTENARAGSENRTSPEDTGVILRPTTIATMVFDPSAAITSDVDPRYWRIWAEDPVIGPPIDGLPRFTQSAFPIVLSI